MADIDSPAAHAARTARNCFAEMTRLHPTGLLPQADAAGVRRQRGRISSARLGLSYTTAVVPRQRIELAPLGAVR
jgi:hypothetical protein